MGEPNKFLVKGGEQASGSLLQVPEGQLRDNERASDNLDIIFQDIHEAIGKRGPWVWVIHIEQHEDSQVRDPAGEQEHHRAEVPVGVPEQHGVQGDCQVLRVDVG